MNPLISCLMVTQPSRIKMARRAMKCFEKQDWGNKEIIIVSSGDVSDLGPFVRAPADITIGELRNIAVIAAKGDLIATWDDDDISSPKRLTLQAQHLLANPNANACMLASIHLAWPARYRFAVAPKRSTKGWEQTMLAWRQAVPEYKKLARGSDTDVIKSLKTVTINRPELYTYVYHGANIWDAQHFESIFQLGEILSTDDPRSVEMREALG